MDFLETFPAHVTVILKNTDRVRYIVDTESTIIQYNNSVEGAKTRLA